MPQRRINDDLFGVLIDQVDTASSTAGGRAGMPEWIIKNTTDPKNPSKNWSFKFHEYQLDIVKCQAPHVVVSKAAQVGISEVMVRMTLAMAAKFSGEHLLYILPTSRFAAKFVASRIDPVIASSPRLKLLVPNSVSSMELKRIGTSHLHIGGASDEKQAISVPAKALIIDEQSFCNPDVLSVFQSRLSHNRPEDRIQVEFSTPLFPLSGITAAYESGSMQEYMCYHDKCGHWVTVDCLRDIVLPGHNDHLLQLTAGDLKNGVVKPLEAWVKCEHCHTEISGENLIDPTRRAWVARFPDRQTASFHIDPLCCARFRTPSQIILDLGLYKKVSRWSQYCCAQPYESADATILQGPLDEAFTVAPISPMTGISSVYGSVAGMDVGQVSHLMHGKRVDGVLEIFNVEKVKQGYEDELKDTFVDRLKTFNVAKGVIDGMPDVSIVKGVQGKTVWGQVWGAFFIRGKGGATLETFSEEEDKGLVKIRRTELIDEFVLEFNAGRIKLPKGLSFEEELKSHFRKPKRITKPDAVGEDSSVWMTGGQDHFFFACLYLYVAAKMLEDDTRVVVMPAGRFAGKARVGGAHQAQTR